MSTALPKYPEYVVELKEIFIETSPAEEWWGTLTDQERIIAALATEPPGHHPCDVAEKPWKWLEEAYDLAQDNAR